ncbi:piggyBac transposable element-derived protein 2-like [Bactrocera tryoni]|uniref:piggyBac transposable element-derived protein 2-like n=1 Tax=Bactrocera tryoni TaxID=59916 RepID=UPI001A96EC78|nr:piggyBac transposable element-derived protein 2-like [Bactrocera tryoni]
MECIQSETVKYAINKGDEAFTVNLEELYTYFGILILSGYNKVPAISMYWQTESDVYNHLVTNRWSRILVSILSSSLYEENQFAMDTKFGV